MGSIFSAYRDFSRKNRGLEKNPERTEALKRYFERGGVISLGGKGKGWPKLIYPTPLSIRSKIKELSERKAVYEKQHSDWKKSNDSAKMYDLKNEVKKFSEPLYWKHILKYGSDKDYRADTDSIKLPVNLVGDKRWQPMIKMFVENPEYRKNLVETVNYSIVYKKERKVARYAKELKDFRLEVSGKALDKAGSKIEAIDHQIKDLEQILAWASEN
jgi:hypothetical protein